MHPRALIKKGVRAVLGQVHLEEKSGSTIVEPYALITARYIALIPTVRTTKPIVIQQNLIKTDLRNTFVHLFHQDITRGTKTV